MKFGSVLDRSSRYNILTFKFKCILRGLKAMNCFGTDGTLQTSLYSTAIFRTGVLANDISRFHRFRPSQLSALSRMIPFMLRVSSTQTSSSGLLQWGTICLVSGSHPLLFVLAFCIFVLYFPLSLTVLRKQLCQCVLDFHGPQIVTRNLGSLIVKMNPLKNKERAAKEKSEKQKC